MRGVFFAPPTSGSGYVSSGCLPSGTDTSWKTTPAMTARYRSHGALRARLLLLLTAVWLSSLAMPPAAPPAGPEPRPQAAAAIRAANADWLPAMRRADAAAIAAPYADDA